MQDPDERIAPAGATAQETAPDEHDVLLVLEKNDTAQLRLLRTTFRGRVLVDLRLWWRNAAGAWQPSRKGVQIPADEVPRLIEALGRL